MKRNLFIALVAVLLVSACSLFNNINIGTSQRVEGSGVLAREERPVSGFDSIEIAGSADVTITIGASESVVVETDDNIMPLIKTEVRGDTLVIDTRPNSNINTDLGVRLTVTMKSLKTASIAGSGDIDITGVQGGALNVEIFGSGNITATGMADSVNVTLNGSGNVLCAELQVQDARVRLNGSGNVNVYATRSLDATISGSGNVLYGGNPAQVQTSVPGSGSIDPMP